MAWHVQGEGMAGPRQATGESVGDGADTWTRFDLQTVLLAANARVGNRVAAAVSRRTPSAEAERERASGRIAPRPPEWTFLPEALEIHAQSELD